jgi:hypothetical protein
MILFTKATLSLWKVTWVYLTYKDVQEYGEEFGRSIESLSRSPVHHPWIRDVTVMDMGQDGALLVHDREDEWMDD